MASILALRRRIQAAKNVSKTTKAMQMIAASKLKKAQIAALSSRPYVEKLTALVGASVAKLHEDNDHPYLAQIELINKTLLIVLSPDKGLAGGLITNLVREFLQYTNTSKKNSYIIIGKKMESKVVRLSNEIIASFHFGTTLPKFNMIFPILRLIDEYYLNKKVDSVKILYPHFNSLFTQVPKISTLLPLSLPEEENENNRFFLFEPKLSQMIPSLLKHYAEMTLYQHLLESFLSEQASRMIAMQNATNNANDIIIDLQLEYNKTRQNKITSEILDITGAAASSI